MKQHRIDSSDEHSEVLFQVLENGARKIIVETDGGKEIAFVSENEWQQILAADEEMKE